MTASLTIIVSPGSTAVREHIAAWTDRRLLRSSVWVDPKVLDQTAGDLVDLTVSEIGEKQVDDTTLRAVLGDAELRLVRVLLVRGPIDEDVDTEPPFDQSYPEVVEQTWQFADRLRSALPETTDLLRVNVIVPDGPSVDPRMVDDRCDVNVVVSPEDRPSDRAVDHGVARPEIHPAHAAFACATIGALWTDTETGAFDRPADEGTDQPGRIVVARAAARVVDANNLPAKIIGMLFSSGSRSLRQYLPPDPNRTGSNAELVKDVFEAFAPVEDGVLWYRPPAPPAESERRRIVSMTFTMLLRFLLQVFRLRLLEWREEARARLDERVKRWLLRVTADGGELSTSSPPTVGEMSRAAETAPIKRRTSALLPGTSPVNRFLWPQLRKLCFSLIDGGDLPSIVAEAFNTLRPTVTDPIWIVGEPQKQFRLNNVELKLLKETGLPLSDLRVMDNSTMDRLEWVLGNALIAEVPPGAGKGISAHQAHRVLVECQSRLRTWRAEEKQDSSLVGRLLKHVQEQMILTKNALKNRAAEYQRQEEQRIAVIGRLEHIRDRLTRYMLICAIPLALGIASIIGILSGGGRAALSVAIVCALVSGAGLAVLSVMAERAAVLEHELDRIEEHRAHTVALVIEWPGEVLRLTSLYSILLDWAEIIGWLVHQPFRSENDLVPDSEQEDRPRPEAFHLVQPADGLDELAREVARRVFVEGWLSDLYEVVLDSAIPERTRPDYQLDTRTGPDLAPGPLLKPVEESTGGAAADSTAEEPVEPDAVDDTDEIEPVWHARDRLLGQLRKDHEHAAVSGHLRAMIWQTLFELPPTRLTSMIAVNPVDSNGIARTMRALDFVRRGLPRTTPDGIAATLAPGAFSDAGIMNGRPKVSRIHLWGIASQFAVPGADRTGKPEGCAVVTWAPPEPDAENDVYQVALIRLDLSADCDAEDLRHA